MTETQINIGPIRPVFGPLSKMGGSAVSQAVGNGSLQEQLQQAQQDILSLQNQIRSNSTLLDQTIPVPMLIGSGGNHQAGVVPDPGATSGGDRFLNENGTWSYPLYDVRRFGALCDGSTDDTTAIRAAIAAVVSAGGGTVFFPSGTSLVSGYLGLSSNVALLGSGASTIIKVKNNSLNGTPSNFLAASGYAVIGADTATKVYIQNLTIDMNGANQTLSVQAINSIFLFASTYCQILRVKVLYSLRTTSGGSVLGSGIVLGGQCDHNFVANCQVNGPGALATAGKFCGGLFINGIANLIEHCYVDGTTDNGYTANADAAQAFQTTYTTFRDCVYAGNPLSTWGFHAENASATTFDSCIATGQCRSGGFRVTPYSPNGLDGTRTSIVNCQVDGASLTDAGIQVSSAVPGDVPNIEEVWISGGFIQATGRGVVLINDVSDVTIDGIAIVSPSSNGIDISGTATLNPQRIIIRSVRIRNAGTPGSTAFGILVFNSDAVTGTNPGIDVTITGCHVIETRAGGARGMASPLAVISAKGGFTPTITNWIVTANDFRNCIGIMNLGSLTQTNCYIPAGGNLA